MIYDRIVEFQCGGARINYLDIKMAKQKPKKKEKKPVKPEATEIQNDHEKNPFGAGILPDRDLKKNLGCG